MPQSRGTRQAQGMLDAEVLERRGLQVLCIALRLGRRGRKGPARTKAAAVQICTQQTIFIMDYGFA